MLQLSIIVVYFLAVIGIGVWSKRRAESQNGFFVAHRRGTLPLITGSLVATAVGGSALVVTASWGFELGLPGAWWLLVGFVGLMIMGIFFAKKVRSAGLYTLPELVGRQYDHRVSLAASILIVIAWVGVVAGQIVAAGSFLSILGIGSATFWMVVFTSVVITYTILGGQFSVIRTDLFQAAIVFAGIFAALAVVLFRLGGFSELKASLPADYFSFPLSPKFDGKMLLSHLILVGATYVVGPDMYSRLFCARDEKTARNSVFVAAFFFILLAFGIALIGMSAKVLYPQIIPRDAFPQVVSGILSPWLSGLILAAVIAALMSSADTCLLSQSIIFTQDILKRFNPLSERRTVLVTRLSLVTLSLVALALALALQQVYASLMFAYTIFTCGLVVPVIAGFYKEKLKVTPQGALAALIGGGVIGLLGKIPGGLNIPLKGDLGLIGFAASAVLLFGVSFLTRKR